MKKRKSPVLMLALLAVLVAIVGGYNLIQAGIIKPGEIRPEAKAPDIGAKQDAAEMKSFIKNKGKPMAAPGETRGKPAGPGVAIPKAYKYKPTPNATSTSAQWYTDESRK